MINARTTCTLYYITFTARPVCDVCPPPSVQIPVYRSTYSVFCTATFSMQHVCGLLLQLTLNRGHFFGSAQPVAILEKWSPAYYFTSVCSPGRTPETETHQKNLNIIHTCIVQISEHLEKAISFNVDLSKLLLEDAWCIPSLKNVDNGILPYHHPTTLLFQFCPLLLILILLPEHNIYNSHEV